jgi:hypothetical protein
MIEITLSPSLRRVVRVLAFTVTLVVPCVAQQPVDPSGQALCRAISKEIGDSESEDSAVVAANLSGRAEETLLVLDSYESFRLLDSWPRQVFLPSLGESVRTILASCEPPRPA